MGMGRLVVELFNHWFDNMSVVIISSPIYDFKSKSLKIGGVETYVYDLSHVLKLNGFETCIYQLDEVDEQVIAEGVWVYAKKRKKSSLTKSYQTLFEDIYGKENIYIIASDQFGIKSKNTNVITIQHGIAFDIPGDLLPGFWHKNRLLQAINKLLRCYKNVFRFNYTCNTVCVDYNFYNWYRTLSTISSKHKVEIIPNYSSSLITKEELMCKLNLSNRRRIIFARRFVDYRGTLLFLNVAQRILKEYPDVYITFAGDGPLKHIISQSLSGDKRVKITSFACTNSVQFHYNYDIAVIPTIFSEGTSLSLCEAMAAGCFPIATHVGGMTNMILDGYNGRLIYPSEQDLYSVLCDVLTLSKSDFDRIVINAYFVAQSAFSKEKWGEKWCTYIKDVIGRTSNLDTYV